MEKIPSAPRNPSQIFEDKVAEAISEHEHFRIDLVGFKDEPSYTNHRLPEVPFLPRHIQIISKLHEQAIFEQDWADASNMDKIISKIKSSRSQFQKMLSKGTYLLSSAAEEIRDLRKGKVFKSGYFPAQEAEINRLYMDFMRLSERKFSEVYSAILRAKSPAYNENLLEEAEEFSPKGLMAKLTPKMKHLEGLRENIFRYATQRKKD